MAGVPETATSQSPPACPPSPEKQSRRSTPPGASASFSQVPVPPSSSGTCAGRTAPGHRIQSRRPVALRSGGPGEWPAGLWLGRRLWAWPLAAGFAAGWAALGRPAGRFGRWPRWPVALRWLRGRPALRLRRPAVRPAAPAWPAARPASWPPSSPLPPPSSPVVVWLLLPVVFRLLLCCCLLARSPRAAGRRRVVRSSLD